MKDEENSPEGGEKDLQQRTKQYALRVIRLFVALPKAPEATRALAADLITSTFTAVGKQFSEAPRTPAEITAYADAMADMFCAYLESLAEGSGNLVMRP